ncbi:UNVERIFIED_CONTAM: hypothetical protein Scaly_2516700 [Sesamum calycinum]|uniref:Uncharacterized protein n=1 Tax=Sesamum calycinum TaxID=2727403 RepID=A0AAW2LTP3_9LAMI
MSLTTSLTGSQARGLDVLPTTISRFRKGGDDQTAELLEKVVYPEEITHCAAGVKWFKYLCLRSKSPLVASDSLASKESEPQEPGIISEMHDEVIQKFHSTVRAFFRGPLKPPFNEAARSAAGFGLQWYETLAVKDSSAE